MITQVKSKTPFIKTLEILKPFKIGEIAQGVVVGTGRSSVFLDLGARGTGIIYGREFLKEKEELKGVKVGDSITAKIIDLENNEGYIELSLREAGRQLTWEELKKRKESEETFFVTVTGANKGGLLAELYGIQAFLPVSQLSSEHYPKVEGGDPNKILNVLQGFIGQQLEVQVCDIAPEEDKIILSERAKEQSQLKELLEHYSVGDVIEGSITGIVDFGAFVTFGEPPIEGLIHISEIDWQIIESPSEFFNAGDKVKAKIIDISNGRVSLSLKALKEDPWKGMEEKYKKLEVVQGKVTKLNPFGAFVEVEPKVQGLAHISEFGTMQHMEELLEVGKEYPFQILELNIVGHRMTLKPQIKNAASPVTPETPKQEQAEEQ